MHPSDRPADARPAAIFPILAVGLISFAFSPILVRFAGAAPGLAVAVWRTWFAVLMLAPFAFARIGPDLRAFTGRDVALIIGGGVMLGLHFITWIESIYHTSVASATVILTTTPLFLAFFGYLTLKERLSPQTILSIAIGVGGAALIAWGDAANEDGFAGSMLGNALALAAALFQCFYLLVGRVVRKKTDWLAYVFPLYLVAALTTLTVALIRGVELLGYAPYIYGLCALMAIGPQIIGHGSFNYALRYFTAALLGLLALTEPIGASFMALLFFEEMPTLIAIGGMLIVLISVAVVLRENRGR